MPKGPAAAGLASASLISTSPQVRPQRENFYGVAFHHLNRSGQYGGLPHIIPTGPWLLITIVAVTMMIFKSKRRISYDAKKGHLDKAA